VQIEFEDDMNKKNFTIRGIESIINRLNNTLSFMYSGNINELVSVLAGIKIISLSIEEPSLEEIFMHYYK
jgi:ABC-2 type transport system ATP-binding protein